MHGSAAMGKVLAIICWITDLDMSGYTTEHESKMACNLMLPCKDDIINEFGMKSTFKRETLTICLCERKIAPYYNVLSGIRDHSTSSSPYIEHGWNGPSSVGHGDSK